MTIIDTNRNVAAHLAHLKARGVTTIGRYYATSAAKRLTKPEAAAICAAGLDIFVVFEDSGDPQLSVEQGVHDAQIALGQAQAVGQPAGSAIYFALEHEKQGGFTQAHVPGIKRYMDGVRQVLAPTYKIGVYGDGVVCKALLDAQMVDFTWLSASRKHPGTPEFTASGRATLIQRTPVDQNIDGLSVDFNEAKQPEFGAFTIPAAQPAPAPEALASMAAPGGGGTTHRGGVRGGSGRCGGSTADGPSRRLDLPRTAAARGAAARQGLQAHGRHLPGLS